MSIETESIVVVPKRRFTRLPSVSEVAYERTCRGGALNVLSESSSGVLAGNELLPDKRLPTSSTIFDLDQCRVGHEALFNFSPRNKKKMGRLLC